MKNERTAKRIKMALSNKNMKPQELSDLSGVSKASISQYINGSHSPSNISSGKIGKVLNVNPLWLMGFDVQMETAHHKNFSDFYENLKDKGIDTTGSESHWEQISDLGDEEFDLLKKYFDLDEIGQRHVDTVLDWETERMKIESKIVDYEKVEKKEPSRIIQYYQKLASAGTGQIIFDDIPVDLVEIPDTPEYKKVKYAIGVNGRSMEPMHYDGDTLLVEPTNEIGINEIGIFIMKGDAFVKKLGESELISVNDEYNNIPLTEEIRCVGRVVGKLQKRVVNHEVSSPLTTDDEKALQIARNLLNNSNAVAQKSS